LRWLSNVARYQVSEGTYQRYERTCQNHLIPFFGRMKLRDLNAAHVRSFKVRKIEEGLNPNTVGVMQGVLSTALNQAVDDNLIPSNPTARVKKAATRGQSPMRALSHEEASRLLSAAEGTRDEALMTLALRTGLRQGELAALRWEELDLSEGGSVTVRRSADTPGHESLPLRPARSGGWASAAERWRSSGAQEGPARGEDGCAVLAGPRPRLPEHEG
jgi:integrase